MARFSSIITVRDYRGVSQCGVARRRRPSVNTQANSGGVHSGVQSRFSCCQVWQCFGRDLEQVGDASTWLGQKNVSGFCPALHSDHRRNSLRQSNALAHVSSILAYSIPGERDSQQIVDDARHRRAIARIRICVRRQDGTSAADNGMGFSLTPYEPETQEQLAQRSQGPFPVRLPMTMTIRAADQRSAASVAFGPPTARPTCVHSSTPRGGTTRRSLRSKREPAAAPCHLSPLEQLAAYGYPRGFRRRAASRLRAGGPGTGLRAFWIIAGLIANVVLWWPIVAQAWPRIVEACK